MAREEIIGNARLILGDCREVLPSIPPCAILTDPPYGIGIAANPFRQKFGVLDWDEKAPDLAWMAGQVSPVVVWGGNYFDFPPTQAFLIWDKVQPFDFSSAQIEMAWTIYKRPAKMFRRHVVSAEKFHPTTKPIELMCWCLEWMGGTETILDPYMGSGSTGVACAMRGRKFIGIEIHELYFDIACRRIEQAYRQRDLFVDAPVPVDPADHRAADLFAEPSA